MCAPKTKVFQQLTESVIDGQWSSGHSWRNQVWASRSSTIPLSPTALAGDVSSTRPAASSDKQSVRIVCLECARGRQRELRLGFLFIVNTAVPSAGATPFGIVVTRGAE